MTNKGIIFHFPRKIIRLEEVVILKNLLIMLWNDFHKHNREAQKTIKTEGFDKTFAGFCIAVEEI